MRLQLVTPMARSPEPKQRGAEGRVLLPELSDEELVVRVTRGDAWAEEAIYRRYAAQVLGVARRLLGSVSDAEDVAQETFATAFGIWDQLREPSRLKQWLLQIAVRKVHRVFRRRRLLRALGFGSSSEEEGLAQWVRSDTTAEARAELMLLDRAVRRLQPTERIAWMLRHVEGLSLHEVAFECSCSLATAKRRIAAAHRVLSGFIELEGDDG
jgi:RNA polymerase sigma-70 factor (ECF subfamily)